MGLVRKSPVWAIVCAVLAIILSTGILIGWRASRALRISTDELHAEREIRFTKTPFSPPLNPGFEFVSSPAVFLQAVSFQTHLYIATPAGLLEYDQSGTLLRQFVVGQDLPSSGLVAIAAGMTGGPAESQLVIATAEEGLLTFDGRAFQRIYPRDSQVRSVTCILPVSPGRLLIGTKKRGVLLYDGKQIVPLHPTLDHVYVQALAGNELDLWIGTLNQGVLHWHGGASESFGEEQGLPDRQVQAVASSGDKTYVGTVTGVAEFDRGRFSRVLAPGTFVTSLFADSQNLLIGSEEQGMIRIPLALRRGNSNSNGALPLIEVRQFFQGDDGVYVLTRSGVFHLEPRSFALRQVLQSWSAVLTDRNISALASDTNGQLWIGYFDRGLDLLQPAANRTIHVENEHVFCVNRILPDPKSGTFLVATANGLVRFGPSGNQQQVLTRADGLIADHVTDVAHYHDGLAVATPAGLTFLDSAGARSMYAFHGLVNNHVYALGVSGDDLMVGTLGGLSVLDGANVRANYTAGSSGLMRNWITAVVPVGDGWMIGTYGSGILGLDRSGRFFSFENATRDMEINPNAMLVTPTHVFSGTLGSGLYSYDRGTQRWTAIRQGLPSGNVTALAESGGYLYVGTDNGLVRIREQNFGHE